MMDDLISRKLAIKETEKKEMSTLLDWSGYSAGFNDALNSVVIMLEELPSTQSERLIDDDFETIRIHLNAYKEKLCNQRRWKEAEEYERLIERFMAFASADRPMGEWLARDCVFGVVYCSECGYELRQNDTNYCPNCGADMRGGKND